MEVQALFHTPVHSEVGPGRARRGAGRSAAPSGWSAGGAQRPSRGAASRTRRTAQRSSPCRLLDPSAPIHLSASSSGELLGEHRCITFHLTIFPPPPHLWCEVQGPFVRSSSSCRQHVDSAVRYISSSLSGYHANLLPTASGGDAGGTRRSIDRAERQHAARNSPKQSTALPTIHSPPLLTAPN